MFRKGIVVADNSLREPVSFDVLEIKIGISPIKSGILIAYDVLSLEIGIEHRSKQISDIQHRPFVIGRILVQRSYGPPSVRDAHKKIQYRECYTVAFDARVRLPHDVSEEFKHSFIGKIFERVVLIQLLFLSLWRQRFRVIIPRQESILARNRTWSSTFAGSRANPAHSEDRICRFS